MWWRARIREEVEEPMPKKVSRHFWGSVRRCKRSEGRISYFNESVLRKVDAEDEDLSLGLAWALQNSSLLRWKIP